MAILPGSWIRGSVLGAGSFGTVTLAISKADGSLFAVKSVELDRPHELASLENEISILESISSPHIVSYLGNQRSSSTRDAFLEFMPGGSLADLAAKFGGRLDEPLVKLYAKGMLQGLEFLHQSGIVHCDVKGKNVLVGSQGQVKLADLGSAKRVGVHDGVLKGTPLWMAPEVVRHEQQIPASDIWSFGCTVVELLTGRAPWCSSLDGTNVSQNVSFATLMKIACSEETPELPSGVSASCRKFLQMCLCRCPENRATASELLEHEFITGEVEVEPVKEEVAMSPRSPLDFSKFFSSSAGSSASSQSSCSSSMASPKWIVVRSPQAQPKNNPFEHLSDFEKVAISSPSPSLSPAPPSPIPTSTVLNVAEDEGVNVEVTRAAPEVTIRELHHHDKLTTTLPKVAEDSSHLFISAARHCTICCTRLCVFRIATPSITLGFVFQKIRKIPIFKPVVPHCSTFVSCPLDAFSICFDVELFILIFVTFHCPFFAGCFG